MTSNDEKTENQIHDNEGFPTERVKTLVDGIFAIAMTLLVLEIRLPIISPEHSTAEIAQALWELIPEFRGYFISFIILGIFWVGHHNFFHFVRKVDRPMPWFTIFFLMLISLIPFSASLVGKYGGEPIAVAIYGIQLVIIGISIYLGWVYATRHHHLVDHSLPPAVVRSIKKHILLAPIAYAIAVILALANFSILSLAIFVVVPLYYILPNRLDRLLPGRNEHDHSKEH